MMNRIAITTGYMGSGSSAVTDLIGEFNGFTENNGDFEYIFMHCPNGIFDLEDKLLRNNNAVRSDEALRSFRNAMYELYSLRTWWPANYKEKVSPYFIKHVDDFIENLTDFESDSCWYHQEKLPFAKKALAITGSIARRLSNGAISPKKVLRYSPMKLSLPSEQKFYSSAKQFLNEFFTDLGINDHNLLLDQLILPFNLNRIENYFDERAMIFVVDRDPRDVFLLNKYIWLPAGNPVPFPTDVHKFCEYYSRIRECDDDVLSPSIYRLHFEDLIYNYQEMVNDLLRCLELDISDHVLAQKKFNPDKSINNTQLFLLPHYQEEAQIIEKLIPNFLYDFPVERMPRTAESF